MLAFLFVCLFVFFFGTQYCGLKLLPNMINRRALARARMRCLKTFDSFCFQIVLSNGRGDGKNDLGQ